VLARAWWPLASAGFGLVVSPDRARVKECAASDCHWVFLDASRNGSRRWCDMKACGNRAKARVYRHRHPAG
jgi:predicted RNA-binding Zn ribbon-like protein